MCCIYNFYVWLSNYKLGILDVVSAFGGEGIQDRRTIPVLPSFYAM